jgi:hypothetical protein
LPDWRAQLNYQSVRIAEASAAPVIAYTYLEQT